MNRSGRRRVAAIVAVSVLALTACSGVPTSSAPQAVRTIGTGNGATAAPSDVGALPPDLLVRGFINAMQSDPVHHDAARQYLTADAAQSWIDSTVTVVDDAPLISRSTSDDQSWIVTYRPVGSVSGSGIYTPTLAGSGFGPDLPVQTTTYQVVQDNGRFRIRGPVPPGVIIERSDFETSFRATPLYFPDTDGARLIPDLRFSALDDQALESFLLTQLINGPRPELEGAVIKMPEFSGQQRPGVTIGTPTIVQIPGAASLQPTARELLAAQLAFTLRQSFYGTNLVLQDVGGKAVSVPNIPSPFDVDDFSQFAAVPGGGSNPTATFVRSGAVFDSTARPLSGVLGTAKYSLQSAVFDRLAGNTFVAGTSGAPTASRLNVGTATAMTDAGITVPAGDTLADPVWAPSLDSASGDLEVWTASGGTVWQVRVNRETGMPSAPAASFQLSSRTGAVPGTITALSFSPEGSRLALVIRTSATSSQVWVATVLRSGSDPPRLNNPVPITPVGIQMDDVGWVDGIALRAVGSDPNRPQRFVFDFDVDGSGLDGSLTPGLPPFPFRPTAIAVAPNTVSNSAQTWVAGSSDDTTSTVWVQTGATGTWSVPGGGAASAAGAAPSFSLT